MFVFTEGTPQVPRTHAPTAQPRMHQRIQNKTAAILFSLEHILKTRGQVQDTCEAVLAGREADYYYCTSNRARVLQHAPPLCTFRRPADKKIPAMRTFQSIYKSRGSMHDGGGEDPRLVLQAQAASGGWAGWGGGGRGGGGGVSWEAMMSLGHPVHAPQMHRGN